MIADLGSGCLLCCCALQQLLHRPAVVCQARRHSGGGLQGRMNPAEVVGREERRQFRQGLLTDPPEELDSGTSTTVFRENGGREVQTPNCTTLGGGYEPGENGVTKDHAAIAFGCSSQRMREHLLGV